MRTQWKRLSIATSIILIMLLATACMSFKTQTIQIVNMDKTYQVNIPERWEIEVQEEGYLSFDDPESDLSIVVYAVNESIAETEDVDIELQQLFDRLTEEANKKGYYFIEVDQSGFARFGENSAWYATTRSWPNMENEMMASIFWLATVTDHEEILLESSGDIFLVTISAMKPRARMNPIERNRFLASIELAHD